MDYMPYLERLESRSKGDSLGRITLISPSGQVLFDNYTESAQMENHAERPEFASAVVYGAGEDLRRSDTWANRPITMPCCCIMATCCALPAVRNQFGAPCGIACPLFC